jgi:long-chain fatty acid transport protein
VPSFFYSEPVGERYRLGLAVNVPTGIGTDYGGAWAGRYMGQSSSLVFVNFSPVAAYRVNDWLSIGGGLRSSTTRPRARSP